MALSPLNLGRVSFNQQTNTLLESLRRSSVELLAHQGRLATGRSFSSASEDPGTAARVLDMDGLLVRQDQVTENLRHATAFLDATEGAMLDISTLLSDAHAIASQNVGSMASAEERAAAAELISDIVEQLVAVGNRQFSGLYLFAGRDTRSAPFVDLGGGVAFVGDTGDLLALVDLEDEEPINLSGDQLFGALTGRVAGTVDLSPRLTEDTRLEEVLTAAGTGIDLGQLVISRPATGDRFEVDLSSADTMGDIVDRLNQEAGTVVSATLEAGGISLTPVGGAITVTDTGTGRIAADLGLLARQETANPITGAGLRRLVTRTTRISDLVGGAGLNLTGGLLISNGTDSVAIDLSAATTVQDIINAIDGAGLNVRARLNEDGTGIDLVNLVSGASLSVAENGGTTAAELGLRTYDLTTPLSELNFGRGVDTVEGSDDLRITAKDGSTVDVNLDEAATIGEVIAAINAAAADAGVAITAGLPTAGNGIRITDATGGAGTLSVSRLNFSFAIDDLGLNVSVSDPAATELVGNDAAMVRTDSVLTALLDLAGALREDDGQGITDAGERVFASISDLTRVQGVVGARAKAMQARQSQTEEAVFATERLLSELTDLDYAEAVTRFQQAQAAMQATLIAGSQSLSLSLLDFLG